MISIKTWVNVQIARVVGFVITWRGADPNITHTIGNGLRRHGMLRVPNQRRLSAMYKGQINDDILHKL